LEEFVGNSRLAGTVWSSDDVKQRQGH
jgi:hypothetical protein